MHSSSSCTHQVNALIKEMYPPTRWFDVHLHRSPVLALKQLLDDKHHLLLDPILFLLLPSHALSVVSPFSSPPLLHSRRLKAYRILSFASLFSSPSQARQPRRQLPSKAFQWCTMMETTTRTMMTTWYGMKWLSALPANFCPI